MAELAAATPWGQVSLPLELADAEFAALPEVPRVSVAPFRGQDAAVSAALSELVGAGLPAVGTVAEVDEGRLLWAGAGLWFVEGLAAEAVAERLAGLAAVTDQGDGWCGLRLEGNAAREVLARLVPVDLHPEALPDGRAARTLLRHVACLLVVRQGGFDILVMRSFAGTAVADIAAAMRGLAGRAALTPGAGRL